jgi:CoA:oxalate CoA-transferase
MPRRILEGYRVLDFTTAVSGPHCTRMLADLGADVVKVEGPGGDATRRYGVQVNGIGPFFSQQNCGKRSVAVDLSTDGGRELCLSLADVADVVAENFRPGVMDRLGLGWEVLCERNPRLVYAAISGYGREGERAQRRALANVVHAEAGLLERQARRDGRTPVPLKWSAADTYSGLELLAGVLAALLDRATTGLGQRVEVSMVDSMLSVDDFAAFDLWPSGDEFEAQPDPILVPASDGWMMISANPVLVPEPFFELMDRMDLLADSRFVTREARQANRQGLIDEIAAWSRQLPTDALDHLCDAVGLAAGVCRTTRDAISIRRDTAIVDVSDRGDGVVPLISSPQQFSHAESGIQGVVPYLGEHNDEVLREWLGRTEAGELRAAGVLHSARRSD